MQRQRRRLGAPPPPPPAAAAATDADKRVHESTGLSMSANGGWSHIISFSGVCDRTQVMSLVCVAFLRAASALPRSAKFGLTLLGGADAFSLDKIRAAHARFPALHDVAVEVDGGDEYDYDDLDAEDENVVPGLQLLLPQLAGFASIAELTLRRQGSVSFPASLCALTGLKKLSFDGNKMLALPDAIGDLKELTELNVGNNQLTALPDTLEALTGLTKLLAWNNKLTTLPDSIAALTQMKTLSLYDNKFTTFPKPIVKLTSLTELNLYNNKLVTLPDSMAALTALKTLDLSENPLVKPQSSTVEAWLAALEAGGCEVQMPEDEDGEW